MLYAMSYVLTVSNENRKVLVVSVHTQTDLQDKAINHKFIIELPLAFEVLIHINIQNVVM